MNIRLYKKGLFIMLKKYGLLIASLLIIFGFVASQVNAAVRSLGSDSSSVTATETKSCYQRGHRLTSCPIGKTKTDPCNDSNGKTYYKSCSCDPKFSNTCNGNQIGSGASCDNKFEKCVCDTTKFKFDETNCLDGRVLSGTSCSNPSENPKFEICRCPSTYKECKAPLQGNGNVCKESGVDKFASCSCSPEYSSTCPEGAKEGASSCQEPSGTIKYNPSDCNIAPTAPIETCETGGFVSSIIPGQSCSNVTYNGLSCYKDCGDLSCNEAIEVFLSKEMKNPSASGFNGFGVYKGESLSGNTLVIGEDTTGKWVDLADKTAISGFALAEKLSGNSSAEAGLVKKYCNKIPNLKIIDDYDGRVLKKPITLESLQISALMIYNDSNFTCTNCSIDIEYFYSANTKKPRTGIVNLKYSSKSPNQDKMYVKSKEFSVDNTFTSEGYDYNISRLVSIGNTGADYQYPVVFKGLRSDKKMSFKTPFMRIRFAAVAFKYAKVESKKTLIGVYGSENSSASGYTSDGSMTPVSLYNTDWMMYDTENGLVNNYELYLGKVAILGYKPDIDRDSSDNSNNNKIMWSNGQSSARCRAAGRQNHCKNGTNSCNNRLSGSKYAYVNSSGARVSRVHPNGCSEWCKDTDGSDPIASDSVGKIYINKYSWVKGGGRMKLECY